jgi:hypothetical protein
VINDDDVDVDDDAGGRVADAAAEEPFFFAEWFNFPSFEEEEEEEECVRLAFDSLSRPCQRELVESGQVVDPLFSSMGRIPGGPPRRGRRPGCMMPLVLLTLAWAVIALAVVKMQKRRRRRAGQQIFAALHANPDLKLQVDA